MFIDPHLVEPTSVQFFKLITAMLLGGLIGTERAILAKQAAGTRTFGLVALGACLFVLTGIQVDSQFLGLVNLEPMQMAGAIVTGIGFIGGGLIIFRHDALHGVTTAAALWIAAGIGIACGFGMLAVAIFVTILTLVMFTGMWYIEHTFKSWFESTQSESGNTLQ